MNAGVRAIRSLIRVSPVILIAGVPVSAIRLAVNTRVYGDPLEVLPDLFGPACLEGVLLASGAVLLFRLAYGAFPDHRRTFRGALLALLPGWFLVLFHYGLLANRELLPGFLEPKSIAWNAAGNLVAVTGLYLGARRLRAWFQDRHRPLSRTGFTWRLALGFALLSVPGYTRFFPGRDGPDIVVILIDVLRADHLGCYGYERDTSPEIDAFAKESVLFEQAISQGTFTKTSVASLFTGLYPYKHGVYLGSIEAAGDDVISDVLRPSFTTLAEYMDGHGYLTAAWVQNAQLRAYMGFAQGFDLYRDQAGWVERLAPEFGEWIKTWGPRRPVFTYIHLLDVHGPYAPAPPYDEMFGRYSDTYDSIDKSNWLSYKQDVLSGRVVPTDDELLQLTALYDGEIAYIDTWIRRILDDLREAGIYDDALVLLTADHGDGFFEHGFIAHSNLPFDELIHVPLIAKLPGGKHAGERISEQVGLVDVLPTLVEHAGGMARDIDGRSLTPLLESRGGDASGIGKRTHVIEHRRLLALRTERWKYIHDPRGDAQLYDLENDPGEQKDLVTVETEVAERLHAEALQILLEKVEALDSERVIVDPETLAELRALGYGG